MNKKTGIFLRRMIRAFPYLLLALFVLSVIAKIYVCPFYYFFGIPCAGCGMTRAMRSLLSLNIKAAYEYHCLFPIPIFWCLYYLFRRRLYPGKRAEAILLAISAFLFIARWWLILFSIQ